jgi:hypothetical protein
VTEVCFVLAPGQNHFFVEVVDALRAELEQLGIPTETSRAGFPPSRDGLVYVLVPPHEFRGLAPAAHWPTTRQLERTLFYCFEQPGTKFFDGDLDMGRGPVGAVLDINANSVGEFRRNGVPAHHAPVGWTPSWAFADATGGRDVDLLHLGTYSPRRGEALARSADRLARWRTALVLGDDHGPQSVAQANFTVDDDKWELLARSRVLLNIHIGDRPYFEWLRVVQAICNGVFVVSEHSTGTDPLRAGAHFATGAPEELVALAEPYLDDEGMRAAAAEAARAFLEQRMPFRKSAELVAELASEVARRPTRSAAGSEPVPWPDNSGIRAEVFGAASFEAVSAPRAPAARPAAETVAEEPVLMVDPGVELLPAGLERMAAALDRNPPAAFAWGMVADEDAAPPRLLNVFPWQPWRLDGDGDYIQRPVLWRAAALRELSYDPAAPDGDRDLYRRAAGRDMHGTHVPQVVARVVAS